MSQISDFLENELLDAVFNAESYTPAGLFMSLHTADPGETGADEVTGGSYARQDVSAAFGAAATGQVTTTVDVDFTDMPAVTVTHIGIWDAATAGNFLWGATLSASKTTNSGDTFRVESGQATFTLD